MEFVAAARRAEDDRDRDLILAWQTAVFATQAFTGKLTDLRTLLAHGQRAHGQSLATQRQMLEQLSEQYGIPLKVVH